MSLINFMFPPPRCGQTSTDFWCWIARTAQLRFPHDVSDDMWVWSDRGVLNLHSTGYPDRAAAREISHGRTGNHTRELTTPKPRDFVWGRNNNSE
jgi:hypothetical protein